MTRESKIMSPLTPFEMANEETEQARMVKVFIDCFIAFPTSDNFELTLQHMRTYQTKWMNGRERI